MCYKLNIEWIGFHIDDRVFVCECLASSFSFIKAIDLSWWRYWRPIFLSRGQYSLRYKDNSTKVKIKFIRL